MDGESGRLDSLFGDLNALLVVGFSLGSGYRVLVDVDLLMHGAGELAVNSILWSEPFSIFSFSDIDWAGVLVLMTINLNASVRVFGVRSASRVRLEAIIGRLPPRKAAGRQMTGSGRQSCWEKICGGDSGNRVLLDAQCGQSMAATRLWAILAEPTK